MARAAQQKVYADFSGGYITEGSKLSYPENAASELLNFDLKENGSVQRRLGLGFEASNSMPMPTARVGIEPAVNTFKWEGVGGDALTTIAVLQLGDRLDFYLLKEDGITDSPLLDSITIPKAAASSIATADLVYQTNMRVASGSGKLFVVSKYIDPCYLTIDLNTGAVTRTVIDIKIRDFEVWKEGQYDPYTGASIAGEVRQGTLTGYHEYNLGNQGWPRITETCDVSNDENTTHNFHTNVPISYTKSTVGFYPDTSELMHQFQNGGGEGARHQLCYNPWKLVSDYKGNTKAARGHNILEYFAQKREGRGAGAADHVSETEYTDYRPTAVAFYAGRVWFSGTQGSRYSSEVTYSQILTGAVSKVGNCYQEADPTAEVVNELIATDGGVLSIEEMGTVYNMTQFGSALLLITSNGVWAISGEGEIASFSATSFSITKVSDKAALSNNSITEAKDSVYFLGTTAIYQIGRNEVGTLGVTDISSATIKTFYQELSTAQKSFVFSLHDEGQNRVIWYYPSEVDILAEPVPIIDKALYLDLSLAAFGKYEHKVSSASNPRAGIPVDISSVTSLTARVVNQGIPVLAGGVEVMQTSKYAIPDRSSIKILIVEDTGAANKTYRFADYRDTSFKDLGIAFPSSLETGFDALGDIMRKTKQAPKIIFHLERTETGFIVDPLDADGLELLYKNQSGCLVSYKWDWGELPYGRQFQAYKLSKNYTPSGLGDTLKYDRSVATSTTRLRGRGTSLGFKIESEEGKDLKLLGYGLLYTASARI